MLDIDQDERKIIYVSTFVEKLYRDTKECHMSGKKIKQYLVTEKGWNWTTILLSQPSLVAIYHRLPFDYLKCIHSNRRYGVNTHYRLFTGNSEKQTGCK